MLALAEVPEADELSVALIDAAIAHDLPTVEAHAGTELRLRIREFGQHRKGEAQLYCKNFVLSQPLVVAFLHSRTHALHDAEEIRSTVMSATKRKPTLDALYKFLLQLLEPKEALGHLMRAMKLTDHQLAFYAQSEKSANTFVQQRTNKDSYVSRQSRKK